MLFQEEGNRWEAAWENNKALAECIEQTGQTIKLMHKPDNKNVPVP